MIASAMEKHPDHVQPEYANLLLELLIALNDYPEALDVLCRLCHVKFESDKKSTEVQVNLFQKLAFLNQLTQNMTRDCSLNSPKDTSSQHVVYKYCFECQLSKQKKQFLYTTCCELVFFQRIQ
jgi:hypothetical protein